MAGIPDRFSWGSGNKTKPINIICMSYNTAYQQFWSMVVFFFFPKPIQQFPLVYFYSVSNKIVLLGIFEYDITQLQVIAYQSQNAV